MNAPETPARAEILGKACRGMVGLRRGGSPTVWNHASDVSARMAKPRLIDRRNAIRIAAAGAATLVGSARRASSAPSNRPNVLLITADDMNHDSLGVTGCKAPDITPNLDRLAAQGLRFEHAHVTIAVCQPNRSVLMTGRFPHRNGAEGFEPIRHDVPTLQESLRAAGYLNGILGKVNHLAPPNKFCWDVVVQPNALGNGRSPEQYYQHCTSFFEQAKQAGKPFLLMANSHDPHRPFPRSDPERTGAKKRATTFPEATRYYLPDEVEVPGFLPDLPDIRTEIAQYYTAVHRCDETVGAILRALRETGLEDSTLVMFLSDNGMAFPFAKTNVYLNSTKTPWIVRWPRVVLPGRVDRKHLTSSIDFMPTILEAAGCPAVGAMDGRSFLPLLKGEQQNNRDTVMTVFHETSAKRRFEMRCIQDKQYGYIFNPWSDGKTVFRNESQSGLTFRAMQEAAKTDSAVAARVNHFLYRVPEESYDFENDPNALHDLINRPQSTRQVDRLRKALLERMDAARDPLIAIYRKQLGAGAARG